MTYNVRYGTAQDGENSWNHRRSAVLGRIRENAPDILGVQEALSGQVAEIGESLPSYAVLGVGRDDGLAAGEYCAIFVRKKLLKVNKWGTRWISATPEQPGSIGPGAKLPRIFTWAELQFIRGPKLLVVNTHFDHESSVARTLGAKLIAEFVSARDVGCHAIVMGDLNSGRKDTPCVSLEEKASLKSLSPDGGPFGTFNGFKLDQTEGDMIDHILVSIGVRTKTVRIDRTRYQSEGVERNPSDHFPVVAELEIPGVMVALMSFPMLGGS